MAKRFIDTGLFDDEWFSELPCDAKIFWLYYLTKCDHAGLLKFNKRLIEFQCGFKDLEKVLDQFPNRIVRVSEQLLFCPKFIDFQYPGFPDCKFKAAISAKDILIKNNIDPNSYQSVSQDLNKSYGNGNGKSNGNGDGMGKSISKETKPKKTDHLFSESPFFDFDLFCTQFVGTQYEHANFNYYHEVISNWSASNGNKKKDWIATAKNWMAGDMTKGKFIDNKFKPNGNTKTYKTGVSHITDQQINEAAAKRFGSR
jgi:hypothetical protein